MTSKPKDWIVAAGMGAILFLFFGLSMAMAADMKILKKGSPAVSAWICGYSAGFEDGIRKLDDPRTPETPQCDKFRSQAKSVLK